MNPYPLDLTAEERQRLDQQFSLLSDPNLDLLLKSSIRILDVGCGTGVVARSLLSKNSKTQYTGIDIQVEGIESLKKEFVNYPNFQFFVGDVTQIPTIRQKKYDLIVCRLVLWAIPQVLESGFLSKLFELLDASATFYCYEPDDTGLLFEPQDKSLNEYLKKWQSWVISQGRDPFIGAKLRSALAKFEFSQIKDIRYRLTTRASNADAYEKTKANLAKVYSLKFGEENLLEKYNPISSSQITELYHAIIATKYV